MPNSRDYSTEERERRLGVRVELLQGTIQYTVGKGDDGMNGKEIDKWSEKHVGSLALTRTVVGFLNVALSVIVVAKLFGWI